MTDPLIARLRAADPAAAHALPLPSRAALRRRRARRSAPRLAAGALGVAGAVTLALSLAPSNGSRLDQVVARAAAATAPAEAKIVAVAVRKDGSGTGYEGPWSLWEEATTWVRFSATGEVLAVRMLMTDGSGGDNGPRAGVEDAAERVDGHFVSKYFDPVTKKVRTDNGQPGLGLIFEAHRLLTAARAGDKRVELDGEETIDGRRAYRLVVTAWDENPLPKEIHERVELLIDTETYQPIMQRTTTTGTTVNTASMGVPNGSPYTYHLTERVVRYTELPDTPENRKLLALHGR